MKILLNPEGRIAKDSEVLPQLNVVLFDYFYRVFKEYNLEKRIEISNNNEMKQINVYFSIILKVDLKFKKKKVFKEQIKNFRTVFNLIRRNSSFNENEDNNNPFEDFLYPSTKNSRIKLKKNMLQKMGNTFLDEEKENNNEEESKVENIKEIEDYILNKIDKDAQSSCSSSDLEEEEDLIEYEKIDYRKCLKDLFCYHLNDFRKDIVEYFLLQNSFEEISFEKFVYYIEFFSMLFTGLNIKYYIDELQNLNLDFYGSEKAFMNLAETFHYQVQFRIKDIPIILQKDGTYKSRKGKTISLDKYYLTKDKELKHLNQIQYFEYYNNQVEFFPPFTHFIKANADKFRRYDENDNFHFCDLCSNINDYIFTYNLPCSSVFRKIDKCRLTYAALSNIMNIGFLKVSISKDNYLNKIIQKILFLPNHESFQRQFKFEEMLKIYSNPFRDKKTRNLNKIIRSSFGELIGFYFSWMTHFIHWLIFPASIGLIYKMIKPILKKMGYSSSFFLYINLFFDILIVLWGNHYVNSWKKNQDFLNVIWGMDKFKIEKESNIIFNEKGEELELFMGIKIPVYDNFQNFINNLINFILVLISLFGTMAFNLIWFYVENIKMYDSKNPIGKINNPYWLYIIPVMIYLTREILSKLYAKLNKYITERENFFTKQEYELSMLKKQLAFEFFNYYFNLYYIAFGKKYFEKCAYNDCYQELGNQLTIIIISDITVIITKSIYYFIYMRSHRKKIDKIILEKDFYSINTSKKYRYFTRSEFGERDISQMILPVIFNFGYVIQFGITSKISFFFMFLLAIFFRIITGFNIKYLVYINSLSQSNGIGLFNRVQKIMAFLGIISNLGIIFYTNNDFILMSRERKFFYFLITENVIFIILKLFKISYFPNWYEFKTEVEMKYLKNYAIRGKTFYKEKKNKLM